MKKPRTQGKGGIWESAPADKARGLTFLKMENDAVVDITDRVHVTDPIHVPLNVYAVVEQWGTKAYQGIHK